MDTNKMLWHMIHRFLPAVLDRVEGVADIRVNAIWDYADALRVVEYEAFDLNESKGVAEKAFDELNRLHGEMHRLEVRAYQGDKVVHDAAEAARETVLRAFEACDDALMAFDWKHGDIYPNIRERAAYCAARSRPKGQVWLDALPAMFDRVGDYRDFVASFEVDDLDARVYRAIESNRKLFDMRTWHNKVFDDERNFCGTSHCRAGWAAYLAWHGEDNHLAYPDGVCGWHGPFAGLTAYALAYPDRELPDFFAENEEALADIEAKGRAK